MINSAVSNLGGTKSEVIHSFK